MRGGLLAAVARAWESGDADTIVSYYAKDALFEDGAGKAGRTVRGQDSLREVIREMFSQPEAAFKVTTVISSRGGGAAE